MKPIKVTVKKKPTNRAEIARIFNPDEEQERMEKMTEDIARALIEKGEKDDRSF